MNEYVRFINRLTKESQKNLLIINDKRILELADKLLETYELNYLNEAMKPILNYIVDKLKTIPVNINRISTEPYNSEDFLMSEHNKVTNIQINTLAYEKFRVLNTQDTMLITYPNINNLSFEIHFYYCNTTDKIQDVINTIINRLHLIVLTFSDYHNLKHLSQIFNIEYPLKMYLYLYPFNRNIDYRIQDTSSLEYYKRNNCFHCSSGYSNSNYASSSLNNKKSSFVIVCTRIPEMLGLFTHEMFHVLHLDTRYYTIKNNNNNLEMQSNELDDSAYKELNAVLNKYNKKVGKYQFLETFNNTTTTIFHTLYCSIELSDSLDTNRIINLFNSLIKKEIIYSIYHTCKILHNQNINKAEEYFNVDSKPYQQLAYLYEYTIVRSFMFINLKDYVDYLTHKDLGNFDGNNTTQVNKLKTIVASLLDNAYKSMYLTTNDNYNKLFDTFVEILDESNKGNKSNKNNKSKECDVCGPVNMEYFCIDHNFDNRLILNKIDRNNSQIGGYKTNYYNKYLKYKIKYCKLKSKSDSN